MTFFGESMFAAKETKSYLARRSIYRIIQLRVVMFM